jgi:hypothetical protein
MERRLGAAIVLMAAVAGGLACRATGGAGEAPGLGARPAAASAGSNSAAPVASSPPNALGALAQPRFDWGAPVAIGVQERSLKAEKESISTYDLEVCPRGGGQLVVTHRGFKFLRVAGRSASDPEVAAALQQVAPLLSAIPAFVVDRTGLLVEVEGIEAMLDRMEAALPNKGLDRLRSMLEDPGARRVFMAAASDRWQAWVGFWTQFDPRQGAQQIVTEPMPGPPSAEVRSQIVVDRIVSPSHVWISRQTKLEGAQAAAMTQNVLKAFGVTDLNLQNYETTATLSVVAELGWPQLQPKLIQTRKVIAVTGEGKTQSRVEERHYTFDAWEPRRAASCHE